MGLLGRGLATCLLGASFFLGGKAYGQSPDELATGRQLFTDALADEEHGRFAAALEKYKRVVRIRDTAPIRYRMGVTLEALGKLAQAVESYTAAVRLATASGTDAEVAKAAQARVDALGPKIAHVVLRLPSPAPANAEVTVDGEPVAPTSFADVPMDPGTHVVAATAKGSLPYRTQVTFSEGDHPEILVALAPDPALAPTQPGTEPPAQRPWKTIGIVTGAAGGVLLVSGIVVLTIRSSTISDLRQSCPDGNCPAAKESELRSTRDRAKAEGPIGAVLCIAGTAAIGAGIVLFALAPRETKGARLRPPSRTDGAALYVGSSSGGAMLTLASPF